MNKLQDKYYKAVDLWLDQVIKKTEISNEDMMEVVNALRGFVYFKKLESELFENQNTPNDPQWEIQEITDEFKVLDSKEPDSVHLIYLKEKFYGKVSDLLMYWITSKKKVRLVLDCDPNRKKMKMQIYTLNEESIGVQGVQTR